MASAMAGCAVTTPASITSTEGAMPAGSSVRMAASAPDGSLRTAFATALEQSLQTHGVVLDADGGMIAEFGIAARSAQTALANPDASTPEAIVWESLPAESHWYDECAVIRLRATLVLLDREAGTISYRGVAESDVCAYSQADLQQLANLLVADAL